MSETDELNAQFDEMGIEAVRIRLQTNWLPGPARAAALKWLAAREASASVAEANKVARQERLMRRSNWIAVAALLVALISLIISVLHR